MPDSIVGKEYLPNVHIEKIIAQRLPEDGSGRYSYKVKYIVSCYDYDQPTWSSDEKFTGYLKIIIIRSILARMSEKIESGELSLNYFGSTIPLGFSDATKSRVSIRGKNYRKFQFTTTRTTIIQGGHLSVYCASAIELQDLKDNEGLDLSYIQTQSYMGAVSGERIIVDGEPVEAATIFYDESEIPWSGPVHRMPSGPYMAGSQDDATTEENLVSKTITNNKINYLDVDVALNTFVGPSFQSNRPQVNLQSRVQVPNFSAGLPNLSAGVPSPLTAASFRASSGTSSAPQAYNPNPQATPTGTLFNPNLQAPPQRPSLVRQLSPYYQEEFVEDHTRNVSSTVITDLENILISESPVASIMYRLDRQALASIAESTNIINIEINRYPVQINRVTNRFNLAIAKPDFSQPTLVARSNNNHQKVKNKILYKISPRQIISVDPKEVKIGSPNILFDGKTITRDLIVASRKIGKVEQLNLTLPANLRAINVVDYSVKFAKAGRYKYQLKLSIKDEAKLYCQRLLKDLTGNARKLQNLYDVLIMKNVFNGDNFTSKYLQEFYSQYNISVDPETGLVDGSYNTPELTASYLVQAFVVLLRAERLIGTAPRANKLINSVNLFSTDLERILNTVTYYNSIVDRFKRTYSLSDGKSSEKASSKSRKDRGVIEKIITLRKEYKRELMKPIGINFISMDKTDGIPFLSAGMFGQRADKEMKKFFPGLINRNNDALNSFPENLKTPLANLEENKFMNFSPAKIFFGKKEVDTTEINTDSFDADFFNTLRIARAAIESSESIQEQDDFDPNSTPSDEELEKYIDSRDFLGDETKFNNAILRVLLKKPIMINKIRKKFSFLDNKILKAKRKSISLKTFDLSQPNNIIAQKLRENPRQVPMQLKALSLLKTPMTNFDLGSIDFDPLSNPQTQEVFDQNYLNLGKVEFLEGFEVVNGRMALDKPIYKEITAKMFNNLKEKNVLCRVIPRSFDNLTVSQESFNIHDKVFVMESVQEDQTKVNRSRILGEENG